MTTENVTVLFTGMADSTAPAVPLAPDVDDELRRRHLRVLRQAIAEAGGSEVKNLGDGLMVVFRSASEAMSCAVAMQQGIEQDNRGAQHAGGLRIGLGGGEVTREEDDYFGDPVIEAARLCAVCQAGQILAADVVRAMAGRRGRHRCTSLPPRSLKGIPDPVKTVEVIWEPRSGTAVGTIPLPVRLAERPAAGTVGRGHEVGLMAEAVKRVAQGRGREVLLVSGEAGVGKTTVVADVAQAAFGDGAWVLFGHCEEDLATPYQLFAETLGHYVTHATDDDLLAHVAAHGSELARLVPALATRVPDLPASKATDSDTERYLLLAAVVGLLAEVSAHRPVLLVLDDLQWADKGSLQLLRHLAASDLPMQVLVVATYRDSELSPSHPLLDTLGALHRRSHVTHIELTGLDDTGVMSLMEATLGHPLDGAGTGLAHSVFRETDGNPFFVVEMVRHLSETGAVRQDSQGRWSAMAGLDGATLPNTVRQVIGGRVGRMGHDGERALSVAAVIGREFDLELLSLATEVSEDDLLDILDAAAAAALVHERSDADTPGRYRFAHALIQHTLYRDLPPAQRASAHRAVAEGLEALVGGHPGARVGELARHWSNFTRPVEIGKAIHYSRQAGDAALAALAPDDALRYYTQALELTARAVGTDPVVALDLAVGLGTAQRQTGDPAYRETLLGAAHRAAELGDTQRLVGAALANDRGMVSAAGTVDTDKVEVLELALDRLPADHVDRALVLAHLCQELIYGSSLERRKILAEEAIAITASSDDDAAVVRVLNHVSNPLRVPPTQAQSLAWSGEALVRAGRLADPVLLFWAANKRHTVAACAGDIEEMDRCLDVVGELAGQLDQPMLSWVHAYELATRAIIAGDTALAERLAHEAFQIGADGGQPDAAVVFGTQILFVGWQRGTMADLIPMIEQTIADNPGIPAFAAALAMAHVEGDQRDEARRVLARFAATGFDLPMNLQWLTGMIGYAEAVVECRDLGCADPVFERLAPWADRFAYFDAAATGLAGHSLGGLASLLGRYEDADHYFAESASFNERVGARFFAARTDLWWGTMLVDRADPADLPRAEALLTRSRSLAEANGYATVARRAGAALGRLG